MLRTLFEHILLHSFLPDLQIKDHDYSCTFYSIVLVWAGIGLIFFLVAGRVLWFGFSMRIMLITH